MNRIVWVVLAAIRTLARRYLQGRDLWGWHHQKMHAHPPYARILIQGVVKALWQETFEAFLRTLAKTAASEAKYLKHGTDTTE